MFAVQSNDRRRVAVCLNVDSPYRREIRQHSGNDFRGSLLDSRGIYFTLDLAFQASSVDFSFTVIVLPWLYSDFYLPR